MIDSSYLLVSQIILISMLESLTSTGRVTAAVLISANKAVDEHNDSCDNSSDKDNNESEGVSRGILGSENLRSGEVSCVNVNGFYHENRKRGRTYQGSIQYTSSMK